MADADKYLDRFLSGDASAFDDIVESFQAALLRFAGGLLGDPARAQDVVQETFIKLLRSAGTLKDRSKLTSWLYRTCRNVAIDEMRKGRKVTLLENNENLADDTGGASVADSVEKRELLAEVRLRMNKLTVNERTCIVLKILDGRSYKEISEITGLSTSNVGFQIHNGLKRLSAFMRSGGNRGDGGAL